MSIISEALKKAHQSKHAESAGPSTPERFNLADLERPRPRRRIGVPWGGIVSAIVIMIVAGLWFRDHPLGEAPGGSAQYAVEEKPAILASAAPKTRARAPRPFSLSGIAEFQDSFVAVLNGKIVKVGDEVDGAEVLAINSQGVELEYRGEQVVLEKTF